MPLTEQQVAELLVKHISGAITPAEQAQLEEWADASPANRRQFAELTDFTALRKKMSLYRELDEPVPVYQTAKPRGRILRWVLGTAAALVLAVMVFFIQSRYPRVSQVATVDTAQLHTIMPASGKAILTLGDGSHVTLDSSERAIQPGIAQQDGQLVYGQTSALSYNTLRTPRGGQFRVTLPDGTNVWLNAASSLRYPTMFNGKERRVEVSGEAYFEVAQQADQPFIVDIPERTGVTVLGTHFNVNAYADEQLVRITLVAGRVKVGSHMLAPGQEAREQGEKITIVKADMEQAMAWRNGIFYFHNAALSAVMRELSRWYDVDVVYEGKLEESVFNGKIGRDLTLADVVEGLRRSEVNCRIENGKLVVMP